MGTASQPIGPPFGAMPHDRPSGVLNSTRRWRMPRRNPSNPQLLPGRSQTGRCSMGNWAARISSTTRAGRSRSRWRARSAIGDRFISRAGRWAIAWAEMIGGDLRSAVAQFRAVAADAARVRDATWVHSTPFNATQALCHLGDIDAARICADAVREAAGDSAFESYGFIRLGSTAGTVTRSPLRIRVTRHYERARHGTGPGGWRSTGRDRAISASSGKHQEGGRDRRGQARR